MNIISRIVIVVSICLLYTDCYSQYYLMPSSNLFISQGATVSNLNHKAKLTGTLGIHYYFTNYFGVSMQTNFINDLGWYQDLAISRNDFKLNLSLGYSAIYNSPSVSLRICYRLRNFFY